jgi:hypothetical protein
MHTVAAQIVLWIALFSATAITPAGPSPASSNTASSSRPESPVQVAMRNVTYHFTEPISVHIVELQGTLTPTKAGTIVIFDDKNSFALNLSSAEIGISCGAMAQIMNEHVFAAADAPIKNVAIASKGARLIIKGELHTRGGLPFEVQGSLRPEPDGRIRFHAEHVKAAHLPVKGLLDLLGLDLSKLINTKKVDGLSADKDDLILNPEQIFPPPHIRGRVTQVKLVGNEIVQVFGAEPKASFAAKIRGNYMAYRDSDLRFGKLTMHQADLTLIDMDPQDPFDFYLDRYVDQLVAGYTKTTPEFGLRVYTRDYNKLPTRARNASPRERNH